MAVAGNSNEVATAAASSFLRNGIMRPLLSIFETPPSFVFDTGAAYRLEVLNELAAGDAGTSKRRTTALHQLQRRTTVRAERIAEAFAHLEMVEVRRFDQFDRLAGRFHRSGEIAALTLEFRCLIGAASDDDGRAQLFEVPQGAHRLLHAVGEFDVGTSFGKTHGLHVV